MRPILCCVLFLVPASLPAQASLAHHAYSGFGTTSTPWRIEPDSPRQAGPRHEAVGMNAAKRFERELPEYRYLDRSLGIPERFEAVFYAEKRPVRVAIHLKTTGEGLGKQWTQKLRTLFDYLDRDGDGQLNAFEADFLLSNNALEQFLYNGFAYPTAADTGRSLEDFDLDLDRRVSFDEFLAYHAATAKELVSHRLFVRSLNSDNQITDKFFKLIDLDSDGKLSKNEVEQLVTYLKRFDADEDECLTVNEILPGIFNSFGTPAMPGKEPVVSASPLEVFPVGKIPERAVEQMLLRYDRDKNLRLSVEESGLDAAAFGRLDLNKDNELSLLELLAWRDAPADFELEMTLDPQQANCKAVLLNAPKSGEAKGGLDLQVQDGGRAVLTLGNQKLSFATRVAPSSGRRVAQPNELNQVFAEADVGNKGYIAEKDLVGPAFQLMRLLFDLMDRDADGKLTRKEFNAYAAIQSSFSGLPLLVQYGANTPSLFAVLDQNSDNRLSLRELRDAWSVLSKLESPGRDAITRSAIQPQGTIDFGKLVMLEGTATVAGFSPSGPRTAPRTSGPIWFARMDRNSDEELSRSEFLGSREDFDKIDSDRDDRISLQEALAADKLIRPAKK